MVGRRNHRDGVRLSHRYRRLIAPELAAQQGRCAISGKLLSGIDAEIP